MTAPNTPAMSDDEIAAYANHNCRNDDPFDAARIAIRLTRASDRAKLQEAVEALRCMVDHYTTLINSGDAGSRDPETGS
jgi:hypothetical protein